MSIHPDIHRALIAQGGDLQDAIRVVWQASVPPQFRAARPPSVKGSVRAENQQRAAGKKGAAAVKAKAAASRTALLPRVRQLQAQGLTITGTAKAMGMNRETIRRILSEATQ